MNKENLYELLDIDSPEDFKFYENFECYIECSEEINGEDLEEIFSRVDKDGLYEMMEGYLEGLCNFAGEHDNDFAFNIEKEKACLLGLCENNYDEESNKKFVLEMEEFRRFYTIDSEVIIEDSKTLESYTDTLVNAYWTYRGEKFDGTSHLYNLSNLNLEVSEYMMSLNDLNDIDYDYSLEDKYYGDDDEDEVTYDD